MCTGLSQWSIGCTPALSLAKVPLQLQFVALYKWWALTFFIVWQEKGKYDVAVGMQKSSEEMVKFWQELLGRYPSVIAVIDPLRKQVTTNIKTVWINICHCVYYFLVVCEPSVWTSCLSCIEYEGVAGGILPELLPCIRKLLLCNDGTALLSLTEAAALIRHHNALTFTGVRLKDCFFPL